MPRKQHKAQEIVANLRQVDDAGSALAWIAARTFGVVVAWL